MAEKQKSRHEAESNGRATVRSLDVKPRLKLIEYVLHHLIPRSTNLLVAGLVEPLNSAEAQSPVLTCIKNALLSAHTVAAHFTFGCLRIKLFKCVP